MSDDIQEILAHTRRTREKVDKIYDVGRIALIVVAILLAVYWFA